MMSKTGFKAYGNRFLLLSAATVICCLGTVESEAQNLSQCVRPISMPAMPDVATATVTEMQAARDAVDAFLSQGEAYIDCVAPYADNPLVDQIRQQLEFEMDLVTGRFNDALCAYSNGSQCVLAPSDEFSDFGLADSDPSELTLEEYVESFGREDAPDTGEPEAPVVQATPFEDGTSLDLEALAEIRPDGSGNPEPDSRQGEPSLPDGTPCGAVEEVRREASGNGAALRAHYSWQVYNDCFTPIDIRWTFRGDGLFDSERTIQARGSQILSCSTPAGTLSGRFCTGGIQYIFEWP
jgi:hypothetical protein